jgi:hypothetical protein
VELKYRRWPFSIPPAGAFLSGSRVSPLAAGTSPSPLLENEAPRLLTQRNPNPKPAQHLHEGEGEEHPVPQTVPPAAGPAAQRYRAGQTLGAGALRRRRRGDREEGQEGEDQDAQGGLRAPVLHQPDLLGHRESQDVGEAHDEEHYGEQGGGRRGNVEGGRLGLFGNRGQLAYAAVSSKGQRVEGESLQIPWPPPEPTPGLGRRWIWGS